jgi:protein-disulfide isomerase
MDTQDDFPSYHDAQSATMKSSSTIPIAILIGGIILAGAVYLSVSKKESPLNSPSKASLVTPVGTNDHILGNPAAKVMIVEYSDFECSYCKTFDGTLRQIVANEGTGGSVALVYREFPLTEIHPNAMDDARAAECVAQTAGNDAFWKFANSLFMNQPVDPAQYSTLAEDVGLSGDAFANCYSNAQTTVDPTITADRQNAITIGAQGTPYSLILVQNMTPVVIDGAYPYDAVKQLVDQALAQAQ